MKLPGIPQDGRWRVLQQKGDQWRTWLIAATNISPGSNPLYPKTAEQDAYEIFATVSTHWPDKTWAVVDPQHNFVKTT